MLFVTTRWLAFLVNEKLQLFVDKQRKSTRSNEKHCLAAACSLGVTQKWKFICPICPINLWSFCLKALLYRMDTVIFSAEKSCLIWVKIHDTFHLVICLKSRIPSIIWTMKRYKLAKFANSTEWSAEICGEYSLHKNKHHRTVVSWLSEQKLELKNLFEVGLI